MGSQYAYRGRTNGATLLVSINTSGTAGGNGDSFPTAISTNGQFVLFEGTASNLVTNDANNASDVFLRDIVNNTAALVSVNTNGQSGSDDSRSSTMTPDGRYIAEERKNFAPSSPSWLGSFARRIGLQNNQRHILAWTSAAKN